MFENLRLPFAVPGKISPWRLAGAVVIALAAFLFLTPLLGWRGIVLGWILGPITFVAVLTDDRPIQGQVQRAVWATLSTTLMYLFFTVSDGRVSAKAVLTLLWAYLFVDGAVQTLIQGMERFIEPSISNMLTRFGLVEPLLQGIWLVVVLIHAACAAVWWVILWIATRKVTPFKVLSIKRPHIEDPSAFSEFKRFIEKCELSIAAFSHLEALPVTAGRIRDFLLFDEELGLYKKVTVDTLDDSTPEGNGSSTVFQWRHIGRLLVIIPQGVLFGLWALGKIAFKAFMETGICLGIYVLWYLDNQADGSQDLATKLGLQAIIQQALRYSQWQAVNRILEPLVLALFGSLLLAARVQLGRGLKVGVKYLAEVALWGTEYLTEVPTTQEKEKVIAYLPPARETADQEETSSPMLEVATSDREDEKPAEEPADNNS